MTQTRHQDTPKCWAWSLTSLSKIIMMHSTPRGLSKSKMIIIRILLPSNNLDNQEVQQAFRPNQRRLKLLTGRRGNKWMCYRFLVLKELCSLRYLNPLRSSRSFLRAVWTMSNMISIIIRLKVPSSMTRSCPISSSSRLQKM